MTFVPCRFRLPSFTLSGMYINSSSPFPTDSAALSPGYGDAATRWPATVFPPYTEPGLQNFLARLSSAAAGDLMPNLPTLSEPNLYTLAAALARSGHSDGALPAALLAELRWRNCRAMGADPTGAVRRGRLLQLVAAFTPLATLGASSLQRHKLAGVCPFCAAAASFQVFLPQVRWRCWACARHGGLLEFAEHLLETAAANSRPSPTPDTGPAAS